MSALPARDRFLALLKTAVTDATLVKLTLGKYRGADQSLKNVFVRPVALKSGPHLSFVFRHATRDLTKNHAPADALAALEKLIGRDFLDAHLFTPLQTAQLACASDDAGSARLIVKAASVAPMPPPAVHDRAREHLIPADSPWLHALGVTNERGQPREGMAPKFRQINKFVELLRPLAVEAGLIPADPFSDPAPVADDHAPESAAIHAADAPPLTAGSKPAFRVADMGSGKGYLTFAAAAVFGPRAAVLGVEARPELVALCNRVARENKFPQLSFRADAIADAAAEKMDLLIALHACDTATDDALAAGIRAGARLLVVSPCCQKEIRPQLTAPPILADALKHGIFQERQAEFVTDALRAQLLEWAGYKTRVFEFVSTEHTAKNLMIAAVKVRPAGAPDDAIAEKLRAFARFYGVRAQRLARHLGLAL